jgi:hypothetical protein
MAYEEARAMKKSPTKTSRARAVALTERDLAQVIGGTGGTIISENVSAAPQGIQGSGRA